ncbi:hypothetical protein DERF_004061 [Dermatophagoides farinae]|uniref:Uncharacterized protein n=1 Tax=Dermatophagoides farinae TaxID=6954 RepID=A0A922IDT3_DERFA|nr:hypothetical protein DERF_004061 [Dermatophagoides farinae]
MDSIHLELGLFDKTWTIIIGGEFKRFDENKRLKKGQILSTTTLTTAKGVNVIIKLTTTLSDD